MIDTQHEDLVPFHQAHKLPALRHGRRGRPTHKSTIYRFANVGVRGPDGQRIKLERVKLPSGSFTSREAVERFIRRLNGIPVENSDTDRAATADALPPQQERASKQIVTAALDAAGI